MIPIGLTIDRAANFLTGEQLAELGRKCEKLGFESVWLLDSFGREPFIAASYLLANTSSLKVGTGVATIYGRDATSAVQIRETLSELYPGRFYMGLGASNPIVIAKRKGTPPWEAVLPKMTAYLENMAEVQVFGIKPAVKAPLYIAAHAPGLQSLALKHAQGIMTWIMPVGIVAQARKHVGPGFDITPQVPCVLSSDAEEARRVARAYLAMYLALPYYQTAYSKLGFDPKECTEGGGSDRLIDTIVAWGTPSAILDRVNEFEQAGATRVVLNPLRANPIAQDPSGMPAVIGDWEGLQGLATEIARRQA